MKRLRFKRMIAIIILFVFFFVFLSIGMYSVMEFPGNKTIESETKVNEKEYLLCRECNFVLIIFNESDGEDYETISLINRSFVFQNIIQSKDKSMTFEEAEYKIKRLLKLNSYSEKTSIENISKSSSEKFFVIQRLSLSETKTFLSFLESKSLLKKTVFFFVYEDGYKLFIKLPNINEKILVDKSYSLEDLPPTVEDILILEKTVDINIEIGESLVKYMNLN